MEWWKWAIFVGMLAIIWLGGFAVGKFWSAWHKSGIPIVGKLIMDGDEIYLNLDGIVELNELRQYGAVTVNLVEVKSHEESAEKTAANME